MHELTKLGRKYGTDKATTHTFTERIYGPLFEEIKEKPISLLEIGAGKVGGSSKMWKEYFTQGEIYCMDPFFLPDQEVTLSELEGLDIHVIRGNQLHREDLLRCGEACLTGYDYIIDDGAHMPDAIQISLGTLFPFLNSGGFYIVEDLSTASRRGHNWEETNVNLDKLDSKGLMKARHVQEHTLEEAFTVLDRAKQWLSKTLTPTECAYLVENIQDWTILDDGGRKNNICIIKKK